MNLYLASSFDEKRGFGAYCAFYDLNGQHALRGWRQQGRGTPDSLALENAIDSITQITHVIPLTVYTTNAYLLKGCTEDLPYRRSAMWRGKPVPHVKLWVLVDRFIDEWVSQQVALEWKQGTHPMVAGELKRLMLR